ncbi:Uncharacterized protein D082_28800 [Synechocystis sp. PCC 6714]|nr:Uncharacterized protein D082_28800 [Synechocystis sp. PCC 6714]
MAVKCRELFFATVLFLGFVLPGFANGKINPADCSFNGNLLYGKIQLVNSFPDVKVEVVTAFPDLKVQLVNAFPDKCGQWQVVTSFPDTKVQIVESFGDVKINFVEAFPGLD